MYRSAVLVLVLATAAAVHAVQPASSSAASSLVEMDVEAVHRAGWDQATWKEAHGAIALLAERSLSARARAAARALVPNLRAEAGWADRIVFTEPKQTWSSPLHFINVAPANSCNYDRARDCKDKAGVSGICVDGAIQNYTARLADTALPKEQRAEALKFLVHFIGDIHQPLHVGNGDDWGGNKHAGQLLDQPASNLHAIWDAALPQLRVTRDFGGDATKWALGLMSRVTSAVRRDWATCKTAGYRYAQCAPEWANESAKLACDVAYKMADGKTPVPLAGFKLDEAYYQRAIPVVERRIAQAAVRLATVLNAVLGSTPKPTPAKRAPQPPRAPRPAKAKPAPAKPAPAKRK